MTTTTAERAERSKTGAGPPTPVCSARLVPLLVLLAGCVPDPAALERTPPPESASDSEGPGLVACELLHLFGFARAGAAAEVEAVALALPCGCRDGEIAWVLEHAPAIAKARVIGSLDRAETARASLMLKACARSADPDERDAALTALTRAGDADVMPLVARALRVELREESLVALAAAARNLGPLRPIDALKTALARAQSARACLAITEALGDALDAEAVRILGARGAVCAAALEQAIRLLRNPRIAQVPRPAADAPQEAVSFSFATMRPCSAGHLPGSGSKRIEIPAGQAAGATSTTCSEWTASDIARREKLTALQVRSRACDASAEAAAALHLAAASAIAEDAVRERELTRWLASRLRRRGPGAPGAAVALGALGGRDATAALAEALRDADGLLIKTVSASLATALRTSPEREPEDPIEIRRLWFPILATLVRKD